MSRRPKPTALKRLEGNPGKRKLNDKEPQLSGRTTCPRWLSPQAKGEWRRVYQALASAGVVTMADRAMLAEYCQAWADLREATETLRTEGAVTTTEKGYAMPSPWVAIRNKAAERLRRAATELGMTPAARSKISVDTPQADPVDDLLAEGRNLRAVK